MDSRMNLEIAQERIADLQRSAAARHRAAELVEEPKQPGRVIALRPAGPDETDELARLATLDSARPLRGETIVAVVDGRLVAAISLDDGRLIADPMVPTADTRTLLQTRATQLTRPRPRRRLRPRRRFRPRFA
jgi:hypothetical protein